MKSFDDSEFETWVEERDQNIEPMFGANYKKGTFFGSRAWRFMRGKVLSVYGRRCMKCCTTEGPIQVDHIKPRHLFPELGLEFSNMQVLCKDCNCKKGFKIIDYRTASDMDKYREEIASKRKWK